MLPCHFLYIWRDRLYGVTKNKKFLYIIQCVQPTIFNTINKKIHIQSYRTRKDSKTEECLRLENLLSFLQHMHEQTDMKDILAVASWLYCASSTRKKWSTNIWEQTPTGEDNYFNHCLHNTYTIIYPWFHHSVSHLKKNYGLLSTGKRKGYASIPQLNGEYYLPLLVYLTEKSEPTSSVDWKGDL